MSRRRVEVWVYPSYPGEYPWSTDYGIETLKRWAEKADSIGFERGRLILQWKDDQSYGLEIIGDPLGTYMLFRHGEESRKGAKKRVSGSRPGRKSRL